MKQDFITSSAQCHLSHSLVVKKTVCFFHLGFFSAENLAWFLLGIKVTFTRFQFCLYNDFVNKKHIINCHLFVKYLSLQFRALKNTQKSLPLKLNALLLLELEKSTNRSLNFKKRYTQTHRKNQPKCMHM